MKRTAWLVLALALAAMPTGCVTRRYVITSSPPGAVVYRDGQPIGATPVEEPFIYYGKYHFRLVKDGFEPLDVEPRLQTPWFQYVGVDFITENFVPYTFRDVQVLHFELKPLIPVRHDDLKNRAEILRQRGKLIQPPPGIILPRRPQQQPPPPPPPAAPTLPAPLPGAPAASPPALPPPIPQTTGTTGGVPPVNVP
jgi:hypothetical protein